MHKAAVIFTTAFILLSLSGCTISFREEPEPEPGLVEMIEKSAVDAVSKTISDNVMDFIEHAAGKEGER